MRKAVIIGADPAGLIIAYELLKKTDIKPIILEKTGVVGLSHRESGNFQRLMQIISHIFQSPPKKTRMNWEEIASKIQAMGGSILLYQQIYQIYYVRNKACSIHVINKNTGELSLFEGDYFISSGSRQEVIHPIAENTRGFTNLFLITKKVYRNSKPNSTLSN